MGDLRKVILTAGALLGLLSHESTSAREIMCNRGPSFTLVNRVRGQSQCSGSVKIQGYYYKCTKKENIVKITNQFYEELVDGGEEHCQDFCKSQGKECEGVFTAPGKCAFEMKSQYSSQFGKDSGCHGGCEGTDFVYCSLYHGYFLTTDENVLKDKVPNCVCRTRRN